VTKLCLALAIVVCALLPGTALAGATCNEPETGTRRIPNLSPPLGEVVIGAGRLQFYSAPNAACAMPGVFVIPKDKLIAYAQRWWHCLTGMFHDHQCVDIYDDYELFGGRTICIACTCGREFWRRKR
jgi:hypothetical protein